MFGESLEMNREDELALSRIKSNIFREIFDARKAQVKEYNDGIVHKPSCFSQDPPWWKNQ